LRPVNTVEGWDARDDRVEIDDLVVTLDSLVEFLAQVDAASAPPTDLLAAIFADADAKAAISDGIRKRLIDRISLRDQPTLDKYQGEVFRLPLNRRLMLSGPPGTGKTTTLIRRLAQKRNVDELLDEERSLVPAEQAIEFFHPDNWVMFTPTDLLKLYLKEAFAKEGISASDNRVRAWADERRRLARGVLRILRSEQGGRFTLDEDAVNLIDMSGAGLTEFSNAFEQFAQQETVGRYESILEVLSHNSDLNLVEIVTRFRRRLGGERVLFDSIFHLVEFHEELRDHVNRLYKNVDEIQRTAINAVLGKNAALLDQLADFLDTITQEMEDDDDDDEDDTDEERPVAGRDRRIVAALAFRRAIFARAISLHEGRRLGDSSRNSKILAWLADRVPSDDKLRALGETLLTLRRVRFLSGTYRNLIDRMPAAYARFKRYSLRQNKWYTETSRLTGTRGRISGAEVDAILLLMLRHGRRFLSMGGGAQLRYDTRIATLESIKQEYVTQVLVDEATDFSAVQLACMLELAHPTFRSFFACGDVHQRVTRWGVKDLSELKQISPDFEVKEIDIAYRQSRQLMDLGVAVAQIDGGEAPRIQIPDNYDQAEVQPVLGERLGEDSLARWLADRIREIERALKVVPSIAIFVDADERIDGLITRLKPLLAEYNLDVVGCPAGRVVGEESQIRVFDVQHIKGLEFEAVFFVGVDALLARYGELFGKLLFVGVTRAATYLGVTCEETLPPALQPLRSHFITAGWN
jgi:hypothetical protein